MSEELKKYRDEVLNLPHIQQLLTERYYFKISKKIYEKYGGIRISETEYCENWDLLCKRVARKIASGFLYFNEKTEIVKFWYNKFYNYMYNLMFLPSSPFLFNALRSVNIDEDLLYKENLTKQEWEIIYKANGKGAFGSCYSMGAIEDSIEGIFQQALYEQATIFKSAGGYGVNFSKLRSKYAPVRSIGGNSTGACSFIDLFDTNTNIIALHSNTKRGANMWILESKHPEIEEFVNMKKQPGKWEKGNISVMINKGFMNSIENDKEWVLEDPTFSEINFNKDPKEIWKNIIVNATETAEPGIIFEENVEKSNNFENYEKINSLNPCGEYINIDKTVCNLGSVNLYAIYLLNNPEQVLKETTKILGTFLSISIFSNQYPLEILTQRSRDYRPIGVGFMGFHSLLIATKNRYGSQESVDLLNFIIKTMLISLLEISNTLAKSYGVYKNFENSKIYKTKKWVTEIDDEEINNKVKKVCENGGLFNSRFLSIAPTGSISYICNISSGIEPIFFYKMKRRVNPGLPNEYEVEIYDYSFCGKSFDENKPEYYCVSQELSLTEHYCLIKELAKYVDMGISKTFNLKSFFTKEEYEKEKEIFVKNNKELKILIEKTENLFGDKIKEKNNYIYNLVNLLYLSCYYDNIKGTTIYVDGSRNAVVSDATKKQEDEFTNIENFENVINNKINHTEKKQKERKKIHYRIVEEVEFFDKENNKNKVYVELSIDKDKKPFELFIIPSPHSLKYCEISNAIGRLFSFLLRNDVPIEIPIRQLRKVRDENGNRSFFTNLIADSIEKLLCLISEENTFEKVDEVSELEEDLILTQKGYYINKKTNEEVCPVCYSLNKSKGNIVHNDGCISCSECGWSACGG